LKSKWASANSARRVSGSDTWPYGELVATMPAVVSLQFRAQGPMKPGPVAPETVPLRVVNAVEPATVVARLK
jgi:hypothetical protein